MTNSDWDECFLLHQRPHGETSLIVDVFTKKNGAEEASRWGVLTYDHAKSSSSVSLK